MYSTSTVIHWRVDVETEDYQVKMNLFISAYTEPLHDVAMSIYSQEPLCVFHLTLSMQGFFLDAMFYSGRFSISAVNKALEVCFIGLCYYNYVLHLVDCRCVAYNNSPIHKGTF